VIEVFPFAGAAESSTSTSTSSSTKSATKLGLVIQGGQVTLAFNLRRCSRIVDVDLDVVVDEIRN